MYFWQWIKLDFQMWWSVTEILLPFDLYDIYGRAYINVICYWFWNTGTDTICISTIVFFHVEWVVQTVLLQDACHRHWSCYTTFGESRETMCAIVYEIKLHIPIEKVVLFLSQSFNSMLFFLSCYFQATDLILQICYFLLAFIYNFPCSL